MSESTQYWSSSRVHGKEIDLAAQEDGSVSGALGDGVMRR
jgi:hypothetical protein